MIKIDEKFKIKMIYIILCISFILKIKNNANTEFTAGNMGGLWNVATILLYLIFLTDHYHFKVYTLGMIGGIFSVVSIVNCIITNFNPTISYIYNLAIIPYFLVVLAIFQQYGYEYGKDGFCLQCFTICFWSLGLFVLYHILQHYITGGRMYVVTDVYYILNMLPFVLTSEKKVIRYSAIGLVAVLLILSGKRTGFVAFCIGLLIWFLFSSDKDFRHEHNFRKKIIGAVVAVLIIVFALNYLTDYYNLNFTTRLLDAFENGESGRDRIWSMIIEDMKHSTVIEWIFGHGLRAVPTLIGSKNSLAHCDFLEIIYDYGLLSFILIIVFYLYLIKVSISQRKAGNQYAGSLFFSIIICLFLSTFSNYLIDATFVTYAMITIGWILGLMKRHEEFIYE